MTDTQTDVRYASPQEWVAYLKTPGLKKHQTQFANPDDTEARCCLGHYCVLSGWPLDAGHGEFESYVPEEWEEAPRPGYYVPADHWLFHRAPVKAHEGVLLPTDEDVYQPTHQTNLVVLNDSTDGFAKVISYIETYIIGAQS